MSQAFTDVTLGMMDSGVGPIADLYPPFLLSFQNQREREEDGSAIGVRSSTTCPPGDFARCFRCVRRGRLQERGGRRSEDGLESGEDLDGAAVEPLHDTVVEVAEGSGGR
ncbi:hypothetical protein CRG98_045819 [Punica granatum]|uniref:Uncharacterized protein n=1 Tax=Punica granatum TaxID=22663 RepID=A0A2I0HQ06_PUNGR|nr:hypothetical protein CRG98_045819 [Punica granatum]